MLSTFVEPALRGSNVLGVNSAKHLICHAEPFGLTQDRLREESSS